MFIKGPAKNHLLVPVACGLNAEFQIENGPHSRVFKLESFKKEEGIKFYNGKKGKTRITINVRGGDDVLSFNPEAHTEELIRSLETKVKFKIFLEAGNDVPSFNVAPPLQR